MPGSKDLDPYVSARAFYGAELRRLREEARLSQDGLGEQAFCSGAYIGQFEAAVRRPQPELSKIFDFVLGSGEHLQRLCRLARESKHSDYFADVADLEPLAATISEYSPMLLPGILQTAAYARRITQISHPFAAEAEIERLVEARMERAERLTNARRPEIWEVVHEAALRVRVGSAAVMHEQLLSIAAAIRSRRLVVQVHPNDAEAHPFMYGLTSILTFAEAPPLVYVEGAYSGQLIDEPRLVARYQASYDVARATSLSFEASLDLIESIAEGYAIHDAST
jgi:transcriptional regulator with XRE-family HTH domain